MFIITSFSCILFSGCGYKADPYWVDKPKTIKKGEK
jgi:hypothetical protein